MTIKTVEPMSCSRPVKKPKKTDCASEKGRFIYKYCPELIPNRTINSILQHKLLTSYRTEIKKAEAFSQLFLGKSEKC